MNSLAIYWADGAYDGSMIMSSPLSKFTAACVKRTEIAQYANDLDKLCQLPICH